LLETATVPYATPEVLPAGSNERAVPGVATTDIEEVTVPDTASEPVAVEAANAVTTDTRARATIITIFSIFLDSPAASFTSEETSNSKTFKNIMVDVCSSYNNCSLSQPIMHT
jgi:hypothetical protein